MAAINDLIARIQDPELRMRIEKEVKDLTKQKKFGLVFENHIPEMTLLYDYPISRGCKVICKSDDDKKLSEDILWMVMKINKGKATCVHTVTNEEQTFDISGLICVAKNGEPIYPCLKFVDSVQNAPDSDLWHTLIEADNYHALQLLAYLYPGMVDCIYIDPPYNSGATDWKYNNNYVDGHDSYRHSKWLAMMESRLLLAKKLLNPNDSVLIITIDEKELLLSAKTQRLITPPIRNADKQVLRILFLKSKPPLIEKCRFVRYWVMPFKYFQPVFIRVFKECVAVDVVHEHDAEHRGKVREAPAPPDALLHDHEQKVCDERHPYLYLYGICTLPVEVSQWEVLLQLLEEQLNLPSLAVNPNNVLHFHLHVVGQQGHEPCLFPFDVRICDDACMVYDVISILDMLTEDDVLHAILHESLGIHVHGVAFRLIDKILLHLRDIHHISCGQFLKLGIVDVCPVQRNDIPADIVGGAEHEAVVGGSRGEADVRGYTLVGMDIGVDLNPSLLLPALRMAAHTLEDEVGEERDGR